jgi:hypothetical protein
MHESHGKPKWGVPKSKDMKLPLANFVANETLKGLGTSVNEWIERFM